MVPAEAYLDGEPNASHFDELEAEHLVNEVENGEESSDLNFSDDVAYVDENAYQIDALGDFSIDESEDYAENVLINKDHSVDFSDGAAASFSYELSAFEQEDSSSMRNSVSNDYLSFEESAFSDEVHADTNQHMLHDQREWDRFNEMVEDDIARKRDIQRYLDDVDGVNDAVPGNFSSLDEDSSSEEESSSSESSISSSSSSVSSSSYSSATYSSESTSSYGSRRRYRNGQMIPKTPKVPANRMVFPETPLLMSLETQSVDNDYWKKRNLDDGAAFKAFRSHLHAADKNNDVMNYSMVLDSQNVPFFDLNNDIENEMKKKHAPLVPRRPMGAQGDSHRPKAKQARPANLDLKPAVKQSEFAKKKGPAPKKAFAGKPRKDPLTKHREM